MPRDTDGPSVRELTLPPTREALAALVAGDEVALSGPVFTQLLAENLWQWEDRDPIVRERARIRVYAARPGGRLLDLEFRVRSLDITVEFVLRDR